MEMKMRCIALALALALPLSGCGRGSSSDAGQAITEFDAEMYVDGFLKENYLGEFDPDYLALVGSTEEDAKLVYEDSIDSEVNFFLYNLYNIEYPTEEYRKELGELYKEIYAHTKYTITSVDELEDGTFAVKVDVEPIDIVQQVDSDWDKSMKEFFEEYPTEVVNAMDDEAYEEFDKAWADQLMKLYKEKLPEIGNLTAKSVVVQIQQSQTGAYSVTAESFRQLDDAIIDYTDNAGTMS